METNVFESEKVLAGWGILWNGKVPWACGVVPGDTGSINLFGSKLEDLEPVSVSIPGRNVGTGRGLGQVGHVWTRVGNSLISRESKLGTGGDLQGLLCGRGVDVASNRLSSDIFNWTVAVDWSPLADILEFSSSLSGDVESSETIMSESLGGKAEKSKGGSSELHFEREC